MLKSLASALLTMWLGFAGLLCAQSSLTLSSATVTTAVTVPLNLSLSSPAGSAPAALQWTMTYSTASVTSVSVAAGASATAAGKSISCAGGAVAYTCIASGLNSNTIANGVVAVVTVTLNAGATTAAIGISSALCASPAGQWVAVSATGGSIARTVSVAVDAVSVSPVSGNGLQQSFTLDYYDASGATDLSTMFVWFNATSTSAVNSCLVEYYRPGNLLYLLNSAGTAWLSIAVGSSGSLANSQCSINAGSTTVTSSSTDLLLTVPVTFGSGFAGAKNVYAYAAGSAANSGWQTLGTWSVPSSVIGVNVASVSPASGSGLQQSFAVQYSDGAGATDLTTMFLWFNAASSSAVNSCMVEYYRPANILYLLNSAGTAWSSIAVGSSGTLANSQCSINAGSTTVSLSSTGLLLTLPITFGSAFGGTKNMNAYAAGTSANSGWQTVGTWSVPASVTGVTAVSVSPASGSALQQSFAVQYSDGAGATDLSTMFVWFNATSSSAVSSCMVEYYRPSNILYLLNDAGTAWSSIAVGSSGTIANSQCSINAASTTVSLSSTGLLLTLPVTFGSGFAGAKNVYAYAAGSAANSGWQTLSTWTVP
jgi:trimeric autotransporter adhesin